MAWGTSIFDEVPRTFTWLAYWRHGVTSEALLPGGELYWLTHGGSSSFGVYLVTTKRGKFWGDFATKWGKILHYYQMR